jgi:hypothetical protein
MSSAVARHAADEAAGAKRPDGGTSPVHPADAHRARQRRVGTSLHGPRRTAAPASGLVSELCRLLTQQGD